MRHPTDGNAIAADAHYEQPDEIGNEDGETCNRVDPPYEGPRRNWRAKPCKGTMRHDKIKGVRLLNYVVCNTCGEVGD